VEKIRNQAKEMFPSVYLTLLSMIQALALEALWSAVNERPHLWAGGSVALVGWFQVVATLQTIFFVWVAFTLLVIRLRWVVSVWDSAIPFALGLAQFALVALIQPRTLHLWFYVGAATACFGAWANLALTRVARREPENADALEVYGRAGALNAYGPLVGWVVFGLVAGGVTHAMAGAGALSVGLAGVANLLVFGLILWTADAWRLAVRKT
jgi:hypothetical protein